MSVVAHNFGEIDAQLASMDAHIAQTQQEVEHLNNEMLKAAGYWQGEAHEQAVAFANRVHTTMIHVVDSAKNYVAKARMANDDMRQQEAANTAMWG